ncbi:GntR family transcriptional regulator [Lederbergia panacisoli]|uniref:GntR family transcriptional regulator n=1 Tax=Lederbergia panacisoli TaxID=1255251 RepID=UPI00214AA561|nr:GntR family transcriptional regulator [Lederbergia panacisoli]MCR2821494.1 GntR family transcriptional regulator [Lederbergia panacisoli]
MILNSDSSKPIYVQISEWIENEIISGNFNNDDKVYSQYQLAELFNINPATAAKGLNILADEQILYKKRGLGMFVAVGARERILDKRRNETLKELVDALVIEAKRLNVAENDLIMMIQERNRKRSEEK